MSSFNLSQKVKDINCGLSIPENFEKYSRPMYNNFDLRFKHENNFCYLELTEANEDIYLRYRTHLFQQRKMCKVRSSNRYVLKRGCVCIEIDEKIVLPSSSKKQIVLINQCIQQLKYFIEDYNAMCNGRYIHDRDMMDVGRALGLIKGESYD